MRARALSNAVWAASWTTGMSMYAMGRQAVRPDPALYRRHTRHWARRLARGIGLDVDAYGTWRLDPDGVYVLMANHQSHIDIVALILALPMVPGVLAKAELRRVPLLGRAMKVGGHVFVERGQRVGSVEALKAAAQQVRAGRTVLVFPEGTRGDGHTVLPFKSGGFVLARQAGVPIVPIGLRGTAEILPKNGQALVPGRVEVRVGTPIEADHVRHMRRRELVATVRSAVCRLSGLPPAEGVSPVGRPPRPRVRPAP